MKRVNSKYWTIRSAGIRYLLSAGVPHTHFVEAAEECPELEFLIVLLHCKPEVRRHRLTELRQQPELLTSDMENWAVYLAGQAHALGLPVIDTSHLDTEAVAQEIEARAGEA